MSRELTIVPVTFKQAKEFVAEHHRHHKPPQGHKFSIGIANETGQICGVIIVGRPVARHSDDGWTLEVTRSATDGTDNANSALYGAARRATFAMGYDRLITYTQEGESGSSLKGAGFKVVAKRPPRGGWNSKSRPRENKNDQVARFVWEAAA